MKKPDFSEDLTVFVISMGEQIAPTCLEALSEQSCHFRLDYIHNISPMSAAFQSMPDKCRTKYFVQVDADMVLENDAIERLYKALKQAPPWVYRVYGQLIEDGVGLSGAVKCWRRSTFRWLRFTDSRTVDRTFHRKASVFGLRMKKIDGGPLGTHRSRFDAFSDYLKSKSDLEKWQFLGRPFARYAEPHVNQILAEKNGFALLGAALAVLTTTDRRNRSKHYHLEVIRLHELLRVFDHRSLESIKFNWENFDQELFLSTLSKCYSYDECSGIDEALLISKMLSDFLGEQKMSSKLMQIATL